MRLVSSAAWVALAASALVDAADVEAALPADKDTVTWRKCVNFMGGYAGSWFAKDTMFKDVRWPDRVRANPWSNLGVNPKEPSQLCYKHLALFEFKQPCHATFHKS